MVGPDAVAADARPVGDEPGQVDGAPLVFEVGRAGGTESLPGEGAAAADAEQIGHSWFPAGVGSIAPACPAVNGEGGAWRTAGRAAVGPGRPAGRRAGAASELRPSGCWRWRRQPAHFLQAGSRLQGLEDCLQLVLFVDLADLGHQLKPLSA